MLKGADINYRHLLYFWMVVQRGGVTAAAEALHVTQPTISSQVRELERVLGVDLLRRSGRTVEPTEAGHVAFRYADRIFSLGDELAQTLAGAAAAAPMPLVMGVAEVLPRLIVTHLLAPLLSFEPHGRLTVRSDTTTNLLAGLAKQDIDLVISDAPVGPSAPVRAFNHRLGESPLAFFGAPALTRNATSPFPACLAELPVLLPTTNTAMRRSLDLWFETIGVRPNVLAEFEDASLLKLFGEEGRGVFPAPSVVADAVSERYGVGILGVAGTAREAFYAVSSERRIRHPLVGLLIEHARTNVFGDAVDG